MLNQPQLEGALSMTYPHEVSQTTQTKRLENINSLVDIIKAEIESKSLQYQSKEERLFLYQTAANEKIAIQFPGQESIATKSKKRPFDFRPKIIKEDGTIIKDLVFADMWSIVEKINKEHSSLIKSLSAIFFRMGRMVDNISVTESYNYEILDEKSSLTISTGSHQITWNKLNFDSDIITSLNFHIPSVDIGDGISISFEAFIYFFSLILENEDSKYYYQKKNLSSGRIPTSDSMILLSSYFSGSTSISTLLQRYVSGFGVGKCLSSEITPATGGLIKIVNRKQEIIDLLDAAHIAYRNNASISVNRTAIRVSIKVNNPKTAILRQSNPAGENLLKSRGWEVFDIETSVSDSSYYDRILAYLGLTTN